MIAFTTYLTALFLSATVSGPLAAKTLSSGAARQTAIERVSRLGNANDVLARIDGLCRSLRSDQTDADLDYCRGAMLKAISPLIAPVVAP